MIDVLKDLIKNKEIQKYLGIKTEEELLNKIKNYSDKQLTDLVFKLIDIEVACEDTELINDRIIKPSGHHLELSKDGLYLFNLLENKVNVYEFNDLKKIKSFSQIKDPRHICFSSNNKYFIITGNYSGKLAIYDFEKLEHIKTYSIFKGSDNYLSNSLFTPDDKYIVTGDHNGYIYLIDIFNDKVDVLRHFDYQKCFIKKIKYISENNEFIFSCYRSIDDYNRNDFILNWQYPFIENNPLEKTSILGDLVTKYSYNSKFKHFIIFKGGSRGELIILDHSLKEIVNTLHFPVNTYSLKYHWSNDGMYLIVSYENNVKIYNYPDLTIFIDLKIVNVSDAYFSHDDKYIIINSLNGGYIKLFSELCNNSKVESKIVNQVSGSDEMTEDNIIKVLGEKIEQLHEENPNYDTTKELRVIESLYSFLFLIEEGGIYQLFLDSSPYEIKEYETSLSLIGAKETLKIIQRAIGLYEEERGVSLKRDMRFLIELNKNLVRLEDWDQINNDYNMINESIDELCYKYYHLNISKIKESL